jgi:hypothetical protein
LQDGIPENRHFCGHFCNGITVTFSRDWERYRFDLNKKPLHQRLSMDRIDEELYCLKGMKITADRTFENDKS